MKILMLNYEFPPLGGGASPVSYEIAKGYAKLGHKVTVVTMGYKDLPKEEVVDVITSLREILGTEKIPPEQIEAKLCGFIEPLLRAIQN